MSSGSVLEEEADEERSGGSRFHNNVTAAWIALAQALDYDVMLCLSLAIFLR